MRSALDTVQAWIDRLDAKRKSPLQRLVISKTLFARLYRELGYAPLGGTRQGRAFLRVGDVEVERE